MIRTAAAEGKKTNSSSKADLSRNLSGFDYDPSKAKHLRRSLHNMNVALGNLLSAIKELSILRGSEITPDGMLGGRGFVMPFRELKSRLNESIGHISDITDTVADELTNPKWKLSKREVGEVKKEKQQIEEKVDEAEDSVDSLEAAKSKKKKDSPEEDILERVKQQNEETPPEVQEISPSDVGDSVEAVAMRRYKDLLDGNSSDKVASVLSRNVMANLVKGE
jgi:hypothetical protein